jgi:hypothetical protein
MSKYGQSTLLMNSVDQLFHGSESDTPGDSIAKNVDIASVQREFETGNDQKAAIGKRFANPKVFFHSYFIEDFCMIADRCE